MQGVQKYICIFDNASLFCLIYEFKKYLYHLDSFFALFSGGQRAVPDPDDLPHLILHRNIAQTHFITSWKSFLLSQVIHTVLTKIFWRISVGNKAIL